MPLERFSIGIGDRFGHQGVAQLRALQRAAEQGVGLTPVWNKSHREHTIIGTNPAMARRAADEAVRTAGWNAPYFVDADHIGLKSVDLFLASSDFFTIDVADFIGKPAPEQELQAFLRAMGPFRNGLSIPGIATPFRISDDDILAVGRKYLLAVIEAGRIYRHIASAKDGRAIVIEVSIDEAEQPQSPVELFFLLGALAEQKVPVSTIAPKFTGHFLKGIDYVGDVRQFATEFEQDVCVVAHAVRAFGLPDGLKLSVHSGSDKFSLYPVIHRIIKARNAGLHLKTAGTTWLEELIGLAASGGQGLALAQTVYRQAYDRMDELCKPYEYVIRIDRGKLPSPNEVSGWSSDAFVRALRHDPAEPAYDPNVRQLLHIGYKVAAEMGPIYLDMLVRSRAIIGAHVTENLYDRHIAPVFLGTTTARATSGAPSIATSNHV